MLKQKIHDAFAAELIDVLYSETSKTRRDAVIDKLKAFEPKVMAILAEEESKAEPQYISHQTEQVPLYQQTTSAPIKKLKDNLGLVHIEEYFENRKFFDGFSEDEYDPDSKDESKAKAADHWRIFPCILAALLGHKTYGAFYNVFFGNEHVMKIMRGYLNISDGGGWYPIKSPKRRRAGRDNVYFLLASDKNLADFLIRRGRLHLNLKGNLKQEDFKQEDVLPIIWEDVKTYAKKPQGTPEWMRPDYIDMLTWMTKGKREAMEHLYD